MHAYTAGRMTRGAPLLALTAALVLSIAACDHLLNVDAPSRVPADLIEEPQYAQVLVNGAVSDFDCAAGSYAVMSGEMTDELEDATLTAARWVYDQRSVLSSETRYALNDCDAEGVYTPLNKARESADHVRMLLQGWTDADVPGRAALMATMAAYGAYSRMLLGEMFCSSVISYIDADHNIVYGAELTPTQMLQSADSMFSIAIQEAQAANVDSITNLALVGRARTRLDLGREADALADAQQVPAGFTYVSTASTTTGRRNNRVYDESNVKSVSSSVAPEFQNVTYNGKPDPRVKAVATGDTSTTGVIEWAQLKYQSASDPIVIASYNEAQLMVAEGDVAAGNPGAAVTIIDNLHAAAGLDPYSGPTDAASVMNQVITERSRELWLTGARMGDVRRYHLALSPAPGTAFRNGGVYGPDGSTGVAPGTPVGINNDPGQFCLKLPDAERQANPNIP
ncbi:MAG TPA: RagB/SusD family nutrient uptake outer membrane protein [Gemmatimonadaceae bacterium]|nr:RagB/SusD family nutrient uptake outer membrane protein [Gemmatimonadaceae bacterium]